MAAEKIDLRVKRPNKCFRLNSEPLRKYMLANELSRKGMADLLETSTLTFDKLMVQGHVPAEKIFKKIIEITGASEKELLIPIKDDVLKGGGCAN